MGLGSGAGTGLSDHPDSPTRRALRHRHAAHQPGALRADAARQRAVFLRSAQPINLGLFAEILTPAQVGSELRRLLDEPSTGLDPHKQTAFSSLRLLELIYEPLVRLDAKLNVVPAIADSWEFSSDNLTLTFKLNPNAKFSDGAQVKSSDVKASFERLLDDAVLQPRLAALGVLRRGQAEQQDATDVQRIRVECMQVFLQQDAARYFDYVLGFTGKPELNEVLREAAPHRPVGRDVE
mgnify:CR=1 FL=1